MYWIAGCKAVRERAGYLVWIIALIGLFPWTVPVLAAGEQVALTIYSDDLALVHEIRMLTLEPGMNLKRLAGLPDRIIPSSIFLRMVEDAEGVHLDELIVGPELTWRLVSERAGTYRMELSYLTEGVNWTMHYVGLLDANGARLGFDSWASISNNSGATYEEAQVGLIAGQIRRVGFGPGSRVQFEAALAAPVREQVGEYHLYRLARPMTLGAGETKQIPFLRADGIQVESVFIFEGQREPGVRFGFQFVNSMEHGLGEPLPAGIFRLYQEDKTGTRQFIGEDQIANTPEDELVRLTVGIAFDLVAERTQTDHIKRGAQIFEDSFEIMLKNRKPEGVRVRVVEHLQGDWQIIQASHDYRKVDAETIEFNVPVEAGEEVKVGYTVRYRL